MKLVRAAAKRAQLCPRRRPIGRLGKARGAERQRLIGAERQAAGMQLGHCGGFGPRQMRGDRVRRSRGRRCLQPALIEIGRTNVDRNPGGRQQRLPRFAARGQHERFLGKP